MYSHPLRSPYLFMKGSITKRKLSKIMYSSTEFWNITNFHKKCFYKSILIISFINDIVYYFILLVFVLILLIYDVIIKITTAFDATNIYTHWFRKQRTPTFILENVNKYLTPQRLVIITMKCDCFCVIWSYI